MNVRQLNGHSLVCTMTFYRVVILTLVSATVILSGCTTAAVVKEAKGQINTIDKLAVLRITDAYKDTVNDTVLICMEVRDMETYSEYEMTLNVPLQKRNRLSVRLPLGENEEHGYSGQLPTSSTGTYVGFQPAARDLTLDCQKRGHQLPVFNLGVAMSPFGSVASNTKPSFSLPNGMSEAVYTIYKDGFIANFGYISTNKIVSDAYSIDIPADSMLDMRTMKNQKPYLYLLTPVTVVVDTVTITVGVVIATLSDPNTYVNIMKMRIGNE